MTERYALVCSCSEPPTRVAEMIDMRAVDEETPVIVSPLAGSGPRGVRVDSAMNRHGTDSTPVDIRCDSCGKNVRVTYATATAIVDMLDAEALGKSEDSEWRDSLAGDHGAHGRGLYELLDYLGLGPDYRVIPFEAFCYAVSKLGKSRPRAATRRKA